jgi:hypothetical protein
VEKSDSAVAQCASSLRIGWLAGQVSMFIGRHSNVRIFITGQNKENLVQILSRYTEGK